MCIICIIECGHKLFSIIKLLYISYQVLLPIDPTEFQLTSDQHLPIICFQLVDMQIQNQNSDIYNGIYGFHWIERAKNYLKVSPLCVAICFMQM